MIYLDYKGATLTIQQIRQAVKDGSARLVCSHGNGRTRCGLAVDLTEDWDDRGKCYSVWNETWTIPPRNLKAAIDAAKLRPFYG